MSTTKPRTKPKWPMIFLLALVIGFWLFATDRVVGIDVLASNVQRILLAVIAWINEAPR